MKTHSLCASLLLILVGTATSPHHAWSAEVPKTARPKIYDESLDGSKQIADALSIAKKANKRVLLQFGANWCGWCHKLHGLFEEDKRIAEKLKSDYVEQGVQRLQDSEQAVLEREEKLAIRRFLAFAGYCFEVLMNEVRHIPPGEKGGKRVAGGMRARPETAGGIDHTLPK